MDTVIKISEHIREMENHTFFTLTHYQFPNSAKLVNLSLYSYTLQLQFLAEIPKSN